MLTNAQTDFLVAELATRATTHGWPEHTAENSRRWLQHGAVIVHVGPEVIAIRTWTGSILRECRMNSADWARRSNEEFYGLEGAPVVDEHARLISQGEATSGGHVEPARRREVCPEHRNERTIGCSRCGLPVIERIGICTCPRWQTWNRGQSTPDIRGITMQIDHLPACPGYVEMSAPVEVVPEPTEIVRPKPKGKQAIVSLAFDWAKPGDAPVTPAENAVTHTCHAHGCEKVVPEAKFACHAHWYSLSRKFQDAVWREYRVGQERRKDPTTRYLAVQQRAVAEIALYRPRSKKGLAGWNEAACREIAAPYLANAERWRQIAIERGEGDPLAFLEAV